MAKRSDTAPPPIDLAARLRERGLEPLYLIEGPEAFLRREAVEHLRALAGTAPAETTFEGGKAELAPVLDELRTLPFLAAMRLVRVTEADELLTRNAAELEPFLDGLAAPRSGPAACALILETDGLDGRLRISKRVRELAVRVVCDTPDEAGLLRFVRERARVRGRSFARGADEALLERFSGGAGIRADLGLLDTEVAKICSAPGPQAIPIESVLALASSLSSEDTFAVVGAAGRGDVRAALEALGAVFRDGAIVDGERKREPRALAPMLLGLLGWDLGRLFKARALLDARRSEQDVVSECKAWRDRDAFLARARASTLESLRRSHELLRQADALLKDNGDPEDVLTTLVTRLALGVPKGRPARTGARS